MTYIGIDIAKFNHFASAISSDGTELMKPFKFTNNDNSFQMFPVSLHFPMKTTTTSSILNPRHTTAPTF